MQTLKKLKLCLLSHVYPPDVGGVAVAIRRHAHNLTAAGHEVHVACLRENQAPGTWKTETRDGLHLHSMGTSARFKNTLADWFEGVVALDNHNNFDLFHGYYLPYGGYVAAVAAHYTGKRAIASARGNDAAVLPFDERRAALVIQALSRAHAVTSVTRELSRKITAVSGRESVHVIYNGVDTDHFKPKPADAQLRRDLGLDERPIIGFLGEARAKKGLGMLLRVYASVTQQQPAQLLLVGGVRKEDRPMTELFRRQYPQLPLRIVEYLPHAELPPYYALCDLVVLPSLRDGLPNGLLEAMACGRPVIASAVGGMLDVVENGVNGVLLPPQNDALWEESLLHYLEDKQSCARLAQAGRESVLERFTFAHELRAWTNLYHDLLTEQ